MSTGTLSSVESVQTDWLKPDYIIHFRVLDALNSAGKVNYFCQTLEQAIYHWNDTRPWLALIDHSQVEFPAWSPYLQQQMEHSLLLIPAHWTGRTATLMNYSSRTYVLKAYLEYRFQRQQPHIEQRLFLNGTQALRWLEAGVPE